MTYVKPTTYIILFRRDNISRAKSGYFVLPERVGAREGKRQTGAGLVDENGIYKISRYFALKSLRRLSS